MSATHQSTTPLHAPYSIYLAQTLSEAAQTAAVSLLSLLPADCIYDVQLKDNKDNVQLNDTAQLNGKAAETATSMMMTSTTILKSPTIVLKSIVDGRGLACPMPLLKTKVALRTVNVGESLYIVATDPNSQADILAFCQQTQQATATHSLRLIINQTTSSLANNGAAVPTSDTIYHFIITKTDTN